MLDIDNQSIAQYFNLYLHKVKICSWFPKIEVPGAMSTLQCLAYIRSELDPEAAGDSDVRGGVFMVRGCKHSQTAPQRVGFMIMIYIKIVLVTLLCQVRADINIDTNVWMIHTFIGIVGSWAPPS